MNKARAECARWWAVHVRGEAYMAARAGQRGGSVRRVITALQIGNFPTRWIGHRDQVKITVDRRNVEATSTFTRHLAASSRPTFNAPEPGTRAAGALCDSG